VGMRDSQGTVALDAANAGRFFREITNLVLQMDDGRRFRFIVSDSAGGITITGMLPKKGERQNAP
jgi:hypothetical protein